MLSKFSLGTVDEAIASGIRLLRFPPSLEAAFEDETGTRRCRHLIVRAYIGIIVFDLFAITDWYKGPSIFTSSVWLRLGLFTPIALALTLTLYRSPRPFIRESFMCLGGGILPTAIIFYHMTLSGGRPTETLHLSLIVIILFLTIVQRIRFWYLALIFPGFLAIYAFALATIYKFSSQQQVMTDLVLCTVITFALLTSYTLERDFRMNYLLSLRGRLLNRELDMISRHDPLTGLGNRRSLEEVLADCERSNAVSEDLAVVLLDIDHFKMFNDSAGHQAGDTCLKRVATIIRNELRDQKDYAFRFGGEEFLILLRATDLAVGIGTAERMRRAIEEAAIPHPALPNGSIVTASFGIACAKPTGEMRATEIIASADAALYAAKRNGRNQVWPRFLSSCGGDVVGMPDRRAQTG
jgi:diguanylate cyclase (GGDEF)-like protein